MTTRRMDSGGFEIVRAGPQVLIQANGKTLVVGTMQLLTNNGALEEPLTSRAIKGFGWSGIIKRTPETQLPGQIEPFVWIEPVEVAQSMLDECLRVVIDGNGRPDIQMPPSLKPLWEAGPGPASHSYSLRPTLLIPNCFEAKFLADTAAALPDREDEGNLVVFRNNVGLDAFGVVVDIDNDTHKGFAVPLSALLTSNAKDILGIQ